MNNSNTANSFKVFTNSLQVAQEFGKKHRDVMKDISELDCSEKFLRDNFKQATYIDNQGKERTMFLMTQSGFMFLIFGYEGEKALYYKIQFIKQFKAMEKFLGADSSDIFNSIFTKVGK